MKNKIVKFFVKQWLLIWIAVTAVGMLSIISFAEYTATENSHMKRVVVSVSEQGMMFSSNYLTEGGKNSYQSCYIPEQETTPEYYQTYVRLWNYSLKNSSKVYPTDIEYTVEVNLSDAFGNELSDEQKQTLSNGKYITITYPNVSGGTTTHRFDSQNLALLSFRDTLVADNGKGIENNYEVKFYGWDLSDDSNICLQMVAKPFRGTGSNLDLNKYKDLRDIGAVIGLKELKGSESNGWRAYISEIENHVGDGVPGYKIDGYNLVLTGSGKQKITIKWNTAHVDINKNIDAGSSLPYGFTAQELSVTGPVNNWKTMTINADTAVYRNRYNLQIYLSGGEKPQSSGFFAEEPDEGGTIGENVWVTYKIESVE